MSEDEFAELCMRCLRFEARGFSFYDKSFSLAIQVRDPKLGWVDIDYVRIEIPDEGR